MFKLGALVEEERAHLRDLYQESSDENSKLNKFTQELQRRRQKHQDMQQEAKKVAAAQQNS